MARQIGDIKITATIDGVSYYKSEGEYFVRMKGGPSKKQILHSPRFARSRENYHEFGACSQAGAFLRKQLKNMLPASDTKAYQRVTQLMSQIKHYDADSKRGERRVSKGLGHKEGKHLLCNFAFNLASPLNSVLFGQPLVSARQELVLDPKAVIFPEGATRVVIGGTLLDLDFDAKTGGRLDYTQSIVFAGQQTKEVKLSLKGHAEKKSQHFYFLSLCFYAEDGSSFQQGGTDSLGCIAIDPEMPVQKKVPLLGGDVLLLPMGHPVRKRVLLPEEKLFSVKRKAPV